MHDPMTVAHEFFRGIFRITIWHVDPETDGSDNSCDWFGTRKSQENGWYPADLDGWDELPEATQRAIQFVWYKWHFKLTSRPWWRHPKWHIHHWRIQVALLQRLRRLLLDRCSECGGRFGINEVAIGNWGGDKLWHSTCDTSLRHGPFGAPKDRAQA